MGVPLLRVNGFDFSNYLNVQHEDGLDPINPDRKAPQFSGSPAFREGKQGLAPSVDNRAWTVPLVLEAANRAALHDLIRQANNCLLKGAMVEFSIDLSVDPISYFTLESGRLDNLFQYYLSVHSTTRATLHLWTSPHATSGTQRLLASIAQGSSAVVTFPATGVQGDEDALANLEVRVGSAIASAGRVILHGVHPHPSFSAYRPATSGLAQTGATVRGASGAIGSQYTAIPVSPTGASGVAYQSFLDPPPAHVGRHRVFAFAKSALSVPIPIYALDRFGAVCGATAVVSQTDVNKWQIVDLGEVQVPRRATGQQEPVPTQYVNIFGGGASGASVVASPALHLNGILYLPLDYSAGVLRTPGAGAASGFGDTFHRLELVAGIQGFRLDSYPNADLGGVWSQVGGQLGVPLHYAPIAAIFPLAPTSLPTVGYLADPGATGFYSLASGLQSSDSQFKADVQLYGGAPSAACASNSHVTLYPKMVASGAYAKAKFCLGPSPYLAIVTGASPSAENLRASAGMPSILASAYLQGVKHTLTVRVLGGRMDVWLATGPLSPSPIVSASHAELGIAGYPALQIQNGPGYATSFPSTAVIGVRGVQFYAFGASAGDIGPREYFRFESDPQSRALQGNASVFRQDLTANYRGHNPQLAAIGTGASALGPVRVVVFQGEVDNIVGNDGPDVALTALERWEYLR